MERRKRADAHVNVNYMNFGICATRGVLFYFQKSNTNLVESRAKFRNSVWITRLNLKLVMWSETDDEKRI